QFCNNYPCQTVNSWLSRLIMVAVDTSDLDMENVYTLRDLEKRADWRYVKAFLENGQGRTIIGEQDFPAYRIVGEVSEKDILHFSLTRGHLFQFEELQSLKKSCLDLYDFIWKDVSRIRQGNKEEIEKLLAKERRAIEDIGGDPILKGTVEAQVQISKIKLQKEKMQDLIRRNFSAFFIDFYKKYSEQFYTCQQYVQTTNINEDTERHWFFAYLSGYFKLEKLGYAYVCGRKMWMDNYRDSKNQLAVDPLKEIYGCNTKELDQSFDAAVATFKRLKSLGKEYYRYIEYDNSWEGSHQRLYSWAPLSGKQLHCVKDKDLREHDLEKEKIRGRDVRGEYMGSMDLREEEEFKYPKKGKADDQLDNIFPDDVRWENFSTRARSRWNMIE
ncbi:MAG: hypothetical protein WCG27_13460, partial [Pseudomonadota bacterium]